MRSSSTGYWILLCLLAFFFIGYVIYPFGVAISESLSSHGTFSLDNYVQLVSPSNRGNWEAVANSVTVSLLSVLFSAVVGLLFAFVFTQYDFPLKGLLSLIAILPIGLPPLVGVISFMFVFGEGGIIPRVCQIIFRTESVPFSLNGIPAIVTVHVYSFYVYFYLFASSALRQLDGSLLEAAAGLGSSTWKTLWRVVAPELRPAVFGASILTFMTSMASFSAPFLLGGGRRFMTTQIYSTKLNGELSLAAAQSILLTLASVAFFIALRTSERRTEGVRATKGVGKVRPLRTSSAVRWISLVLCTVILFLELLPILAIVVISFVREGTWTWQLVPTSFTLANYEKLLSDPHIFEPIRNSVAMSAGALIAGLIIGVPAAYLVTKRARGTLRTVLDVLVSLPYAIPGTVVAIALILTLSRPTMISGYAVLVGTVWIVPIAYLIRTYPLIVRSTGAALGQFDDTLMEAAASFGAGALRRFRKIALPLLLPGIVSGALLCLIATLGEFVSSILLYTYDNRPISVEIFSQLRSYNFGAAAGYSVVLLLLIAFLVVLANRIVKRFSFRVEGINF